MVCSHLDPIVHFFTASLSFLDLVLVRSVNESRPNRVVTMNPEDLRVTHARGLVLIMGTYSHLINASVTVDSASRFGDEVRCWWPHPRENKQTINALNVPGEQHFTFQCCSNYEAERQHRRLLQSFTQKR
jgi:hypothetical protein